MLGRAIGTKTYVALAADGLLAVVLGSESLEGGFNNTTTQTEDQVEGGLLNMCKSIRSAEHILLNNCKSSITIHTSPGADGPARGSGNQVQQSSEQLASPENTPCA